MSDLYIKNEHGEFVPIKIERVMGNDWDGKIVLIKLGDEFVKASEKEEEMMYKAMQESDALGDINATFVITSYKVDFEVLGSASELQDKCILIKVDQSDNLSPLGDLQKKAKKLLRECKVGNKSVTLPAPLTVREYKDVMEVKRRCDIRRDRRG